MTSKKYVVITGVMGLIVFNWLHASNANNQSALRYEVLPKVVQLDSSVDRQAVVVRKIMPDGTTQDLTTEAQFKVNGDIVAIHANQVIPNSNGKTILHVRVKDQRLKIPVTVTNAKKQPSISFKLDVMPVLTKAGCNIGNCHGSARGQDGFHLSLFGYDPDGDYFALTRELPGRRINLAMPKSSLLLEKATGQVPHTGGQLFDEKSHLYQTIHDWLKAGALKDPKDLPHVTNVEFYPQNIVLKGTGTSQQMMVKATYSDGSDRDVTQLAVLKSNNQMTAKMNSHNQVVAGKRGEALVMARFDAFTVGSQVIVIPANAPDHYPTIKTNNYIDRHVNDKLRKMRIIPSKLCNDEIFLRRVFIDIIGQLPTAEDYQNFTADQSSNKREKLIDDLLSRKEFVELWVMKWAERLQMRSTRDVSYKAMLLYYNWLGEQIANNVPLNQIVHQLIASTGGTFDNPPTNYYQMERDTLKVSENIAQSFLGTRLQCTQCHNHPFDRWTMDDYYSFAAFFSQIGRKRAEDPRETIVFNRGNGEVRHPVGNRVMQPKFLGGAVADVKGKDRRVVLADWLTSPDNHYFAQNVANFVWANFFDRGIVDPADDVRVSNPPSNAMLLNALAEHLVEYKYDFKKLVRDICNSRTYQLSTQTNPTNKTDITNFSHATIRRVRAEVLLDCISQVTQTKNKFKGLPLGARAVQIADGNVSNYFLTTFGRAKRETVCTCEVVMEPNLSQALHLINGDTTQRRIKDGGVIKQFKNQKKTTQQMIQQLYIRCLSRMPTEDELKSIDENIKQYKDKNKALTDLFWALLNSKEFVFNH